jgi:hypothetical protein
MAECAVSMSGHPEGRSDRRNTAVHCGRIMVRRWPMDALAEVLDAVELRGWLHSRTEASPSAS